MAHMGYVYTHRPHRPVILGPELMQRPQGCGDITDRSPKKTQPVRPHEKTTHP